MTSTNIIPTLSLNEINEMVQRAKVRDQYLVRDEIIQATQSSRSALKLKISSYYYNDGTSKELLCLTGTVATQYRGRRYNIPIEIWLQEDHPFETPSAYVKPSPNMVISPKSRDVQADGRIILPYLTSWNQSTSTLPELLQKMSVAFSLSPPIFSTGSADLGPLSNSNASDAKVEPTLSLSNASKQNSLVPAPSLPSASSSSSTTNNPTINMASNTVNQQKHVHRFSDIAAEPRRMLLPIQGFENMPLVSLEQAVIPLVSIVSDVEHMVWIVKQNCSHPKDGLTSDESASIMLYTMEWEPYEKSFYVILNAALRAASRNQLKPWFSYLRLVISALHKLPSTHHVVYRGVKLDLTAEYCRGNTVVWWGFSSCTVSIDTLKNEQFLGKSGVRTLFSIECDSGKNIRSHSFYADEDEVLLFPARQFEVIGCLDQENGFRIIQLREIQPKFPLIKFLSS